MSAPVMYRRRWKWGEYQIAKQERQRAKRWKSNLWYGGTYGFPQMIHNGKKPR
jgi:hypothetical protein